MLKTYEYVMYELRSYASPKAKLTQMIKKVLAFTLNEHLLSR